MEWRICLRSCKGHWGAGLPVFDPLWLGQVCVKRFTLQISVTLSCTCIANTLCLWQNDKRRRHRDCADKGLSAFLFCTSFCGRISICVCVTFLDKVRQIYCKRTKTKQIQFCLTKQVHTHTHTHTHTQMRARTKQLSDISGKAEYTSGHLLPL